MFVFAPPLSILLQRSLTSLFRLLQPSLGCWQRFVWRKQPKTAKDVDKSVNLELVQFDEESIVGGGGGAAPSPLSRSNEKSISTTEKTTEEEENTTAKAEREEVVISPLMKWRKMSVQRELEQEEARKEGRRQEKREKQKQERRQTTVTNDVGPGGAAGGHRRISLHDELERAGVLRMSLHEQGGGEGVVRQSLNMTRQGSFISEKGEIIITSIVGTPGTSSLALPFSLDSTLSACVCMCNQLYYRTVWWSDISLPFLLPSFFFLFFFCEAMYSLHWSIVLTSFVRDHPAGSAEEGENYSRRGIASGRVCVRDVAIRNSDSSKAVRSLQMGSTDERCECKYESSSVHNQTSQHREKDREKGCVFVCVQERGGFVYKREYKCQYE